MVKVAIVESLPYEAFGNGDGVYLDGVRGYLTSQGCEVTTFVSDIPVGRRKPWVVMRTKGDPRLHRWRVRQAIGYKQKIFILMSPKLVRNVLTAAIARLTVGKNVSVLAESGQDKPSHDGQLWTEGVLKAANPDIVIYYLGATAFLASFEQPWISVALGGWFRSRWIKAGNTDAAPLDEADRTLIEAMGRADHVAFNNEADIQYYKAETARDNAVLWGMSFPPLRSLAQSGEPVVLYVGARTGPNREGLDWLVAHVWPRVRAVFPQARLRLVGGMASGYSSDDVHGVEAVGFVDDLASEYERAQVVVAPILAGTHGAKTKVAEALGFGRPLVTTSVGIDRGAPHRLDAAVSVFDDPTAFACEVVRLLRDEGLRRERSAGAAATYYNVFSNKVAYASLEALISGVNTRATR